MNGIFDLDAINIDTSIAVASKRKEGLCCDKCGRTYREVLNTTISTKTNKKEVTDLMYVARIKSGDVLICTRCAATDLYVLSYGGRPVVAYSYAKNKVMVDDRKVGLTQETKDKRKILDEFGDY